MTDWPYGIRRAEPEDAALISSRFSALVGSEGAKQVGAWAAWCQREDHYLYLLEKEQLEGLIAVRSAKEKLGSDAVQAEIIAWYVGETSRGHNLGRKLLVHGITVAKRLQCDEAVLWLPLTAHRAHRVAVAAGFSLAFSRETNAAEGVVKECGLCLELTDYF